MEAAIVNILGAVLAGLVSGIGSSWLTMRVMLALHDNEIGHIWKELKRQERVDDALWSAVNSKK